MPAITRTTVVYSKVRENILTKWPAGARLPSERDLAAEYGVSTVTVARALTELTREGLIYRIPGMGTFVSEGSEPSALAPAAEYRALSRRIAPKTPLSRTVTPVTAIVANLGPKRGDRREYDKALWRHLAVSEIERTVQMAGGRSVMLDLADVPASQQESRIDALVSAGANNVIVVAITATSDYRDLGTAVYRATRTGGRSLPVIWAETDRATIWPFDSLRFDCRKATFDATQHLIDLGHRRIAMLAPGETMDWADERIDGFRQALAVNDIAEIPGSVIRAEDFSMAIERYWHKAGRSAAERLMAAETNFTAAVCANDSIALETSLLATERGLTLPDDLSLVGFDDSLEARHYDIATIQLDAALYGREAASQALRRLNEPSLPGHVDQALDCRLVLRGSMAPPRSV